MQDKVLSGVEWMNQLVASSFAKAILYQGSIFTQALKSDCYRFDSLTCELPGPSTIYEQSYVSISRSIGQQNLCRAFSSPHFFLLKNI